jgi:hypothetical protein
MLCLKGFKLPDLNRIISTNPDGLGLLYSDNGLKLIKTYPKDSLYNHKVSEIFHLLPFLPTPFLLHFRTASSSPIDYKNTQPLLISETLGFAHNGNLIGFDGGLSDSVQFALCLKDNCILTKIERIAKLNFSKMVLFTPASYVLINRELWQFKDNVYYSNSGLDNYYGYGYSGVYSGAKPTSGVTSPFIFRDPSKWRMCERCGDFYLMADNYCKPCGALNDLCT